MRRALFLAIVLLFSLAGTALAAAPNDTQATAIELTTIPVTVTETTTTADQTDPIETALNADCGAPAVEHGVWFSITLTNTTLVKMNTEESSYGAGLMLFPSTVAANTLITCGPEQIIEELVGGDTYYLLVFGDGTTAATSGTMILHLDEALPPPDISVTINNRGTVDKQGVAHISGTVTCTSENDAGILFEVFGDVSQRVGRLVIRGFFGSLLEVPCDGSTIPWAADVSGDNGLFAGGKAATVAIGFGCTDFCSEGFAEATIQLRKARVN
jgi:hypothetical protein